MLDCFGILEQTSRGPWDGAMKLPKGMRSVSMPRQIDKVARWMDGDPHSMPSAAGALSVQKPLKNILAD